MGIKSKKTGFTANVAALFAVKNANAIRQHVMGFMKREDLVVSNIIDNVLIDNRLKCGNIIPVTKIDGK